MDRSEFAAVFDSCATAADPQAPADPSAPVGGKSDVDQRSASMAAAGRPDAPEPTT